MEKILTLFVRNFEGDRLVRDEITPGAEWVARGEGVPTRKLDGTCCKVENGKLFKRYDAKNGKTPPAGFIPAQDPDPITGHWPGWIAVGEGPEDKYHREAFDPLCYPNGTYELIGPKINGNPEHHMKHSLIRHGSVGFAGFTVPRTFVGLKCFLASYPTEGVVWHHPDGRMVKIKAKDFGLKRCPF